MTISLDQQIEAGPVLVGQRVLSPDERVRLAIVVRRGTSHHFVPFAISVLVSCAVLGSGVWLRGGLPPTTTTLAPPVVIVKVRNVNKVQDRIPPDDGPLRPGR